TTIDPAELRILLEEGRTLVLDFAAAARYRSAHIPGAYYALRANLPRNLSKLPPHDKLVVTSSDGMTARFAAADVKEATKAEVLVLAGGTDAWREAGLPTKKGDEASIDMIRELWSPYQPTTTKAQMRAY